MQRIFNVTKLFLKIDSLRFRFVQLAVAIALSNTAAQAQSSLRLIGTNIYDFAPVMSISGGSPYTLDGTCTRIAAEGALLSISVTNWLPDQEKLQRITDAQRNLANVTEKENARAALLGGSRDMLMRLSIANMMRKGLLNSPGAIMALSPEEKQIWYEMQGGDEGVALAKAAQEVRRNLKPFIGTLSVILTNAPSSLITGTRVRVFAIPVRVLKTEEFNQITVFDAGVDQRGSKTDFPTSFTVTPTGIQQTKNTRYIQQTGDPQWIEIKPSTRSDETTARLGELASNGVASAQFKLGARMWNGDGAPTNRSEGLGWIHRASYQDWEPAAEWLRVHEKEVEAVLAPAKLQ